MGSSQGGQSPGSPSEGPAPPNMPERKQMGKGAWGCHFWASSHSGRAAFSDDHLSSGATRPCVHSGVSFPSWTLDELSPQPHTVDSPPTHCNRAVRGLPELTCRQLPDTPAPRSPLRASLGMTPYQQGGRAGGGQTSLSWPLRDPH